MQAFERARATCEAAGWQALGGDLGADQRVDLTVHVSSPILTNNTYSHECGRGVLHYITTGHTVCAAWRASSKGLTVAACVRVAGVQSQPEHASRQLRHITAAWVQLLRCIPLHVKGDQHSTATRQQPLRSRDVHDYCCCKRSEVPWPRHTRGAAWAMQ
jgi:hypothetical protein